MRGGEPSLKISAPWLLWIRSEGVFKIKKKGGSVNQFINRPSVAGALIQTPLPLID